MVKADQCLSLRRVVRSGAKDIEGRKAAYAELQRSRVGHKARITGTVEEMLPPEVME